MIPSFRGLQKSPRVEQIPEDRIFQLLNSDLSIREKESRFVSLTGKSRRTFYLYRKRLGLTRSYRLDSANPKTFP